jgi:hypothetical protein
MTIECFPRVDGGCDLHKENAELQAAIEELRAQLATAERHNAELNQRLDAAGVYRAPACANTWAQQEQRKGSL